MDVQYFLHLVMSVAEERLDYVLHPYLSRHTLDFHLNSNLILFFPLSLESPDWIEISTACYPACPVHWERPWPLK